MDAHSGILLSTLVVILTAAFIGGIAVRALRLPPLLGYLAAGIVIGPFTPGYVVDQTIAAELAEIGVALLLFNIGLHFSIKDLISVRRIVLWGALAQIVITTGLGFVASTFLLSSPPAQALMIGLSFSAASTAIATRMLAERRQLAALAGRLTIGWAVVQDVVLIFALVLFPAFIRSESPSPQELVESVGRTLLQIAGFGAVILIGARRVVPKLLGYAAKVGARELFTLAVIVIALGIAYASATLFGVSLALGAFFAGVVIGETDLNHYAAAEALSLQQVFGILFFVSVGMLFDPVSVMHMPYAVVALWFVIIIGMGLTTFAILLFNRVPLETAALVGGVFSQVGEIAFVITQMGSKWGVLSHANRDVVLAVAILSIILVPFVIPAFTALGRWLEGQAFLTKWYAAGQADIPTRQASLGEHVILIGHGRVGSLIAAALKAHAVPYVVIESDRQIMEKLRSAGEMVVFGDATREAVLTVAHPETARLLIVTSPESGQVRRVVTMAKRINPGIEIIVRVHEDSEARFMSRAGIGLAVMGEREIGLGLSAYALQFFGIESFSILETVNRLRQNAKTGSKKA